MCGIGGIISSQNRNLTPLYGMMAAQAHRGPDGEGYVFQTPTGLHHYPVISEKEEGWWALGHKRLSILDPSSDGLQPMSWAQGQLWLTYNGEIYNYKELRGELQELGHRFKTQTDTEVILASYQEWGLGCFKKFNGMWALALVDLAAHQLLLSRDRFGEKPLHFLKTETTLFLASEIKGILAAVAEEGRHFNLHPSLAVDYLQWGMVNHTQDTFFQGIESFPPASYAVISLDNPTSWTASAYWTLEDSSDEKGTPPSFQEAQEIFKALFRSSVALRLRSDVPVGFCLSGGLDSSSIVCAAALENPGSVLATFTAISDLPQYNEKPWADLVNDHVKARSHVAVIQEEAFCASLDALLWHQEEPFTTTSIYAQWCLMALAKKHHIPVILDGQGADEALCGYRKFYLFYLRNLLTSGNFSLFLKECWGIFRQGDRTLWHLHEGLKYLPAVLRKGFEPSPLFHVPGWGRSQLLFNLPEALQVKQKKDLLSFSVPALLRYEDRNAMAWSVESRVPFLDHRLVEYLVSLPPSYKLRQGQTKAILRQAFNDFVPQPILNRRDKMGFATPQERWMKNRLGQRILTHFQSSSAALRGNVNLPEMETQIKKGQNGPLIFRLYLLDKWIEKFNISLPRES